jgi:hypothetical protein
LKKDKAEDERINTKIDMVVDGESNGLNYHSIYSLKD